MILKNGLTLQIMMNEKEKDHYLWEKNKKVSVFMKGEKGGKINTTTPKSYLYCLQKDSEFKRPKGVKKVVYKELRFSYYDKVL